MKTPYLVPHSFKKVGWILFILGLISGIFIYVEGYQPDIFERKVLSIYNHDWEHGSILLTPIKIVSNNIIDEMALLVFLIGALLVGFSKEKVEDEFIAKLRSSSLMWAILINTIVLLLAIIFVYGIDFIDIMVYNMATPLVLFILRFNFLLFRNKSHEE